MSYATVAAVTFDFYDTLVYHRAGRGRGARLMEYLWEHSLDSDPWEHQILYDVFERHGVEYTPHQPAREKQRYLEQFADRVFRRLNVRGPDAIAAKHAERVWQLLGPASLAVFPDVPAALRCLREAGLPSAIVSNWQCGLAHFCAELGLRDAVDHVFASAEVGSAKPSPAIFLEACRRLGVPAERTLHIGDNPIDDFEGARGAGLQVVLVEREGRLSDADIPAMRSLRELPGLLGLV